MSPPLWSYSDIEALKNFLKNINIPVLLASRPFMWQASCPFSFFNQNYCFVTNGLKGWSAKGLLKRVADKVYVLNIATACLFLLIYIFIQKVVTKIKVSSGTWTFSKCSTELIVSNGFCYWSFSYNFSGYSWRRNYESSKELTIPWKDAGIDCSELGTQKMFSFATM